jgi:hypothetical protein
MEKTIDQKIVIDNLTNCVQNHWKEKLMLIEMNEELEKEINEKQK